MPVSCSTTDRQKQKIVSPESIEKAFETQISKNLMVYIGGLTKLWKSSNTSEVRYNFRYGKGSDFVLS